MVLKKLVQLVVSVVAHKRVDHHSKKKVLSVLCV